ncbi:hypothetical protein [Hymenobacter negativus]|uniref:Lipoprotein n=1 Tax=Hymenobacter negativus TaxID=2795026 RepID=A0ABS0QAN7_9BACT|nr:hypothetical protein [Hymenobacter negativus]MBH8559512.1 hypothetical protein [Hymenobacter negativus]
MRQRFLPILLLATLMGCSKSDSNPIVDFGEGEGITYRTGQNLPAGPNDPTDWTSDGEWNKQERGLFPDLSFDFNGTQQPGIISYTTAYPNPSVEGQAVWELQTQRGTNGTVPKLYNIQAVLVNRKYQVIERLGPFTTYAIYHRFDYPSLGLSPNELYRIYYVVYDANGLVYKGHGDVRYTPQ